MLRIRATMSSFNSKLLYISVLSIFFWHSFLFGAEKPKINITLNIINISSQFYDNLPLFDDNDPIIAKLNASNSSNDKILINHDFSLQMLLDKIDIIGPSGRLVHPNKRDAANDHSNYMPPLPFGIHDNPNDGNPGIPIRFAPCKIFLPGKIGQQDRSINLREYYNLELPGYYSAQIKVSAMIFAGGTCNADAPQWAGMLKSNYNSFYILTQKNEVKVEPHIWNMSKPSGEIIFLIKFMDEAIPEDLSGINAYLNYNYKLEVIDKAGD